MFATNIQQTQQNTMEEIFKLLEVTFDKSSKNEDIDKAQKRLMELDKNILEQLKLILSGLTSNNAYSENLKLSALIYLKNYILGKIKSKEVSEQEVWELLKIFIEFLISTELSDKIIANTITLLQNIFNWKGLIKSPNLIIELLSSIEIYLKTQLEQNIDNEANFKIGLFKRLISLLQMIISSKSVCSSNIDQIFNINLNIVDLVLLKNQKIIQVMLPQIADPTHIVPYYEINRLIFDLLFLLTVKIKDFDNSELKLEVLINRYAMTSFSFIIDQSIPNENVMVYITENDEMDKVLNSLKAKNYQLLSAIIQYTSTDIKNPIIQEICIKLIDIIIKNLNFLISKNISSIEKYDKHLDLLFYHIFLFLSRCLNREPILTNFFPFVKKFIVYTLLPFMIASEKDKVTMKTDGEDYQAYIQDIISDHKSRTSRTSIDFLIIRICDKYDGLSSFIFNFCIQLLDFAINSNESSFSESTIIGENYNLLCDPNLNFNEVFRYFNQESLIDISLILLCSLKNVIIKTSSSLSKLKLIFDNYIDRLHGVGSDLIKFDICLVYDVYLPAFMELRNLLQEDAHEKIVLENQNFQKRLDFLFFNLIDYEKNPGTSAQAAMAIKNLFSETNIHDIDSKYITGVFNKLIMHLENIELSIYFDVLIEILCSCKIEENLILAINNSTKRILKEIKSPQYSGNKTASIVVSKCFNIIKAIIDDNQLVSNEENTTNTDDLIIQITENKLNTFDVEKCLEPLMNYLRNPLKIDFEDELLDILKSIMKSSQTITPLAKEIFPYLSAIMEKNSGIDILSYEIFNLYISKDDGFIFHRLDNLVILLEILIRALDSDEIDFSPICSTLLLQIIPHNKLNRVIPENLICQVIEELILKINELNELYFNEHNAMNNTLDMHIFSSYLTSIYSYCIKYPEVTFKIITQKEFLTNLIKFTDLIYYFNFYSTQQSKIIILGISSLLSNDVVFPQIAQFFNKIIAQLFTLLFRQKNEESKKMKQMLNKEFECNFVESDEEEEEGEHDYDEEDDYTPADMMEYKKAIKSLKKSNQNFYNDLGIFDFSKKFQKIVSSANNPTKVFDEYEIFSKVIYKLRSTQNVNFLEWEKSLDETQRNFWNELINTRRVNLNVENKGTINIPRRIVKIKRILNEEKPIN